MAEVPDVGGLAQALPFKGGSFREVVIERVQFDQLTQATFNEAARVLQSGGRITGITGKGGSLKSIREGLENAGFKDVRVEYGLGDRAGNYGIEFSGVK